jgi:hypothetical protein
MNTPPFFTTSLLVLLLVVVAGVANAAFVNQINVQRAGNTISVHVPADADCGLAAGTIIRFNCVQVNQHFSFL